MSIHSIADDEIITRLILSIGFLALAGSALVAHATPAIGYELSVYSMTPSAVWIGLLVALAIALAVSFVPFSSVHRGSRSIALALGGLVMVVFTGLPLIRNYQYYGHHDALTHLGWATAISDGSILPTDLAYPGIHTSGTFISAAIGIPISRAMLFVTLLATIIFLVFIPLCVRNIIPTPEATTIATFSAFLLLPITTIATHHHPHPMTQAVLFSALFVYVLTKYLQSDQSEAVVSIAGVTLALLSVAAVVYHPQLVAHLLPVAIAICLVQFFARRSTAESSRSTVASTIRSHRPLYGQTLFLLVVFLAWTASVGFYLDTVAYITTSAADFIFGTGEAGAAVASQGASLSTIGASMTEIFLKLFGTSLVMILLVAGLIVAVFGLGVRTQYEAVPAMTAYFTAGLAALGALFVLYFIASGSEIYFRVFGLMMVFAIVLGSVAITIGFTSLSRRLSRRSVQPLFSVGFAILLVASLLVIFPSPYIYNASPHVTDSSMNGYETAFENQSDDIEFVGLRGTIDRFDDAIHGNEERMRSHESASESAVEDGLVSSYDSDRYLILTKADYEREQHAYHGLRYTEQDLQSATTEQGVDRIQSNGDFELYYVNAGAE